ncbi:hypothetical protein [Cyclobacterium amurskyense]|uniref:hypothetical protein n=1 Tax=Cyclobacterium amurskyense TaxID=320787 RepID=UPI00065E43DE|nr:hypothetical protein [Cyclobacterium amurskyense]
MVTIPPKSLNVLFNNPVAEATGYNHATSAGVFNWIKRYYVDLVIGKPDKIDWCFIPVLVG